MIRMVQSTSPDQAKKYFQAELSITDYYVNDQELQGKFQGLLAERIGVTGPATKDVFFALCDNVNPITAEPLTPRTRDNRTTGYDINFHCPKSVSVLHALAKDDHILKAFEQCVSETMKDIEADSKTRIRKDGVYGERATGELIWTEFTHQTARPIADQLPDPHLHSHCFVFNATWDEQERRIKAGQFRDVKRDMPYYQARFHKRLSDKMMELGYWVRRTDKAFEVEGVPQKIIDHFSKRTDEIGRIAREKGITDAKELDALGAKTRGKKQAGLTMQELRKTWREEMRQLSSEKDDKTAIRFFPKHKREEKSRPSYCIDYALQHCFERASVMDDRRVLETAYRHSIGDKDTTIEAVTDQFQDDQRVIRIKQRGRILCTTKEVLKEEKRMVELARQGQNKFTPLYKQAPPTQLKDQQADAFEHVLTTSNQVSIIRGVAGAGKTTLIKELVPRIQDAGKQVYLVAPTAETSRGVLRDEGFSEAETVAKLLIDKETIDNLDNQVLVVDEAGLLGTQDMLKLLNTVTEKKARLILIGDTRQHSSVVRGDALRILNTVGGIKAAEVSKIHRQKNVHYKQAVEQLSKGNVRSGFEKLDAIGSIKSVDPLNVHGELVDDYVAVLKKGKSALVISPTHNQGDNVTVDIRKKLRQAGMIGKKEIEAMRLSNVNFTVAQKADWRNYKPGQVVQFNQHLKGIKRASRWAVKEIEERKVTLENKEGKTTTLPHDKAEYFEVFEHSIIGLSKGDKVRVTHNGFDKDNRRLDNGMTLEVASIKKDGNIILHNKASKSLFHLDSEFGHLTHAHCITSHASQGKTVDEVFIAQPAATFSATNAKQFYVSVSRGKERARIYTDDKEALLDHVLEIGDRLSAMQLVNQRSHSDYVVENLRTEKGPRNKQPTKTPSFNNPQIDRDYEPEI